MSERCSVFVSWVQKELEDERLIVQNLLNTDPFLSAHSSPLLYEYEPASPDKALVDCLKCLDRCQVYLLIVAVQYGARIGDISIIHAQNTGSSLFPKPGARSMSLLLSSHRGAGQRIS
jgi:hypothetical protein